MAELTHHTLFKMDIKVLLTHLRNAWSRTETNLNLYTQTFTHFKREQLLLEQFNDNATQISAPQSHLSGHCQQAFKGAV